jgi:hypothetical protein
MWKKSVAVAMVVAMTGSLVGCFGSFRATKNVYNFNRTVHPNAWVREGMFLGMVIIPVYPLATLFDALILNSLEFWTGRNPLAQAGDRHRVDGGDGSYAVSTLQADGSFAIEVVDAAGGRRDFNAQKTGDRIVVRDSAGQVLVSQVMLPATLAMADMQ